jgi:hypothetical protein
MQQSTSGLARAVFNHRRRASRSSTPFCPLVTVRELHVRAQPKTVHRNAGVYFVAREYAKMNKMMIENFKFIIFLLKIVSNYINLYGTSKIVARWVDTKKQSRTNLHPESRTATCLRLLHTFSAFLYCHRASKLIMTGIGDCCANQNRLPSVALRAPSDHGLVASLKLECMADWRGG